MFCALFVVSHSAHNKSLFDQQWFQNKTMLEVVLLTAWIDVQTATHSFCIQTEFSSQTYILKSEQKHLLPLLTENGRLKGLQ